MENKLCIGEADNVPCRQHWHLLKSYAACKKDRPLKDVNMQLSFFIFNHFIYVYIITRFFYFSSSCSDLGKVRNYSVLPASSTWATLTCLTAPSRLNIRGLWVTFTTERLSLLNFSSTGWKSVELKLRGENEHGKLKRKRILSFQMSCCRIFITSRKIEL